MQSGPSLELLTRRLAECPADFLLPPGNGEKGTVHVRAVLADLLRDLGGEVVAPEQTAFVTDARFSAAVQSLSMVAAWLLHDAWFVTAKQFALPARDWLATGLGELAAVVRAERFVQNPDRREELARLALAALGFFPAGEPETQAADRLTTLSSVERKRVLDATREAHEHSRRVREAMKKKAAEEGAARYARE